MDRGGQFEGTDFGGSAKRRDGGLLLQLLGDKQRPSRDGNSSGAATSSRRDINHEHKHVLSTLSAVQIG